MAKEDMSTCQVRHLNSKLAWQRHLPRVGWEESLALPFSTRDTPSIISRFVENYQGFAFDVKQDYVDGLVSNVADILVQSKLFPGSAQSSGLAFW